MPDPDLSEWNPSEPKDTRSTMRASAGLLGRETAVHDDRFGHWIFWRTLKVGLILTLAFPILCDIAVSLSAIGKIYDKVDEVPPTSVALVLGTAKHQKKGPNLFYGPRMQAAVALFESGRVQGILVSGDNSTIYYNEPETMRRDLVASGIPEEYITLDYAGFRTLDSMVRAKEVFGLDEVVVVSQRFHAQRAIFLGTMKGIRVTALAAADPKLDWYLKVRAREVLARTAAVIDLFVGRKPRFLGAREKVNLRPPQAQNARPSVRSAPA